MAVRGGVNWPNALMLTCTRATVSPADPTHARMTPVARVIFMGTPDFAVPCLQTLIATQTVVGVVTQPDKPAGRGHQLRPPPVAVAAADAGIPVYQPRSLRREEAAEPLRAWQPDVIVVAAFGQILRPRVLYLPPHGSVNVHASLLPRWRGASPIQHALLAGDATTGVTLMRMDEGMDTGPMLVQEAIAIRPDETAATLHDRLAALGAGMLRRHLDDILAGRVPPQPQPEEGITYAPLIGKEAGRIDWTTNSATLDRLVRAMTPWPGAFTEWAGAPLKVLRARPTGARPDGPPGLVVAMPDGLGVLSGTGALLLDEVQPAGKRAMTAAEFARGRPEFVGSVLGRPRD